ILRLREFGEHVGVAGRIDIAHRAWRLIGGLTPFRKLLRARRIHEGRVGLWRLEVTIARRRITAPVAEDVLQLPPGGVLFIGIYGADARGDDFSNPGHELFHRLPWLWPFTDLISAE